MPGSRDGTSRRRSCPGPPPAAAGSVVAGAAKAAAAKANAAAGFAAVGSAAAGSSSAYANLGADEYLARW
jgi:hypothetical protein